MMLRYKISINEEYIGTFIYSQIKDSQSVMQAVVALKKLRARKNKVKAIGVVVLTTTNLYVTCDLA
jgi:hypothetical protein